MKLGVVGLPNVGKSTLFNAITKNVVPSENYPFCTIEPNSGIVGVPDKRLYELQKVYNSKRVLPATIEFVDIAGLVKGASKGEGLGNKFLSHIREVDAIVHVVRCFESSKIIHVEGSIDPIRDIETINLELILSDLESATKRLERVQKGVKMGDKTAVKEKELLEKVIILLENQQPARALKCTDEEQEIVKSFFLITSKKVIYCANVSEQEYLSDYSSLENVKKVQQLAQNENAQLVVLSAKLEEELSQLEGEDLEMFKEELQIEQSGLEKLIVASYDLLGLMSYLTAGEQEVRAWTINKGTKAPQAAGKIHTDFEKGFIKAEIINYEQLIELGSLANAKEKGKVRVEGKEYVMQDGDVVLFRFNV